jgi:hypothetical protein
VGTRADPLRWTAFPGPGEGTRSTGTEAHVGTRYVSGAFPLRLVLVTLGAALGFSCSFPETTAAQRWALPDSVQRQVDDVFSFVERGAPGCALGVVKEGELAFGRGYGMANLD